MAMPKDALMQRVAERALNGVREGFDVQVHCTPTIHGGNLIKIEKEANCDSARGDVKPSDWRWPG